MPEFTLRTWASLKPERIGAGTIYHHALAGGWNPDPTLVLNGGILVNGRHPARALLERLVAPDGSATPSRPPPPQRAPVDPRISSSTVRSSSSSTTSWRVRSARSRSSPLVPRSAPLAR